MKAKVTIKLADVFFAGGHYKRIRLIRHDGQFDELGATDSHWFIQVRKGTPTHRAIWAALKTKP
jgi:hypothetical protein